MTKEAFEKAQELQSLISQASWPLESLSALLEFENPDSIQVVLRKWVTPEDEAMPGYEESREVTLSLAQYPTLKWKPLVAVMETVVEAAKEALVEEFAELDDNTEEIVVTEEPKIAVTTED